MDVVVVDEPGEVEAVVGGLRILVPTYLDVETDLWGSRRSREGAEDRRWKQNMKVRNPGNPRESEFCPDTRLMLRTLTREEAVFASIGVSNPGLTPGEEILAPLIRIQHHQVHHNNRPLHRMNNDAPQQSISTQPGVELETEMKNAKDEDDEVVLVQGAEEVEFLSRQPTEHLDLNLNYIMKEYEGTHYVLLADAIQSKRTIF